MNDSVGEFGSSSEAIPMARSLSQFANRIGFVNLRCSTCIIDLALFLTIVMGVIKSKASGFVK